MAEEELERTEVEALLETRRELGRRYDAELVDGFADRIERAVEARQAEERERVAWERRTHESAGQRQLALGIVSGVISIPTTAIALAQTDGGATDLMALLVTWGGLVGINVAHAWQSRPRRRR